MFARNLGIVTAEEQAKLAGSTVAVAGVGGDGGMVSELLCRLGIGGLHLADPECFELENLNRQTGSTQATVGRNKAEVVAELVASINPTCRVTVFNTGINEENVGRFVDGVDVVVDATEITRVELGVALARAARAARLPCVTGLNVGFGTVVTGFAPDGITLEEFLGAPEERDLATLAGMIVPLQRWIPRLPGYVDVALVEEVASGTRPAPSVAPGVAITAGAVATEVVNWLTTRRAPIVAPRMLCLDALDLHFEVVNIDVSST